MIRFILLSLLLILIHVDYSHSDETTILLVPNNPNVESEVNSDLNILSGKESGINEIIINEEEITVFNNNSDSNIINSDLNLSDEGNNNLERLSIIWKNSDKKNINFLFLKLNHN